MKKYNLILLGLLIISVISCKDDDIVEPPVSDPDPILLEHMPIAIGNYWVYEHYYIDESNVERKMNEVDSVVISRDTNIRGKRFYILEGTNYPYVRQNKWGIVNIFRDSAGYLVTDKGEILFSATNFSDTFSQGVFTSSSGDTLYSYYTKMEKVSSLVTTPSGTYNVLDLRNTLVFTDPRIGGGRNERAIHNYYAKGVGRVLSTWLFSGDKGHHERRLVRYKVK
jgi:hypothetical protein